MHVELTEGTPPVVSVTGEIDLGNVDKLLAALDAAIPKSSEGIVIDMCDVTYIDSAGIQAVISAYQRVRKTGGVLALALANRDVKAIFALIHPELLPGFIVTDSVDAGKQAVATASDAS